jgi:hypothetical protein
MAEGALDLFLLIDHSTVIILISFLMGAYQS